MRISRLILILAAAAVVRSPASANAIDLGKTYNKIDAGYSYVKYYSGSAPSTSAISYSVNEENFYLGGASGSRLYYTRTRDGIGRTIPSSTFWSNIFAEERGVYLKFRFAKLNNQAIGIGTSRKAAELLRFREYSYMGACNPCIKNAGADSPDVTSFPFTFDYYYNPAGPLSFSAGYHSEQVHQFGASQRAVGVDKHSVSVDYSWKKLDAGLTLARLSPSVLYTRSYPFGRPDYLTKYQLSDNNALEMRLAWKPRKHLKLSFAASSYNHGVPLADSAFSPTTGIGVFSYLYDGSGASAYQKEFKYYSFGIEVSLK